MGLKVGEILVTHNVYDIFVTHLCVHDNSVTHLCVHNSQTFEFAVGVINTSKSMDF